MMKVNLSIILIISGNSYWIDNWRWCNQEKENEKSNFPNITSDTPRS